MQNSITILDLFYVWFDVKNQNPKEVFKTLEAFVVNRLERALDEDDKQHLKHHIYKIKSKWANSKLKKEKFAETCEYLKGNAEFSCSQINVSEVKSIKKFFYLRLILKMLVRCLMRTQ